MNQRQRLAIVDKLTNKYFRKLANNDNPHMHNDDTNMPEDFDPDEEEYWQREDDIYYGEMERSAYGLICLSCGGFDMLVSDIENGNYMCPSCINAHKHGRNIDAESKDELKSRQEYIDKSISHIIYSSLNDDQKASYILDLIKMII